MSKAEGRRAWLAAQAKQLGFAWAFNIDTL
jgi:hypothetical protein